MTPARPPVAYVLVENGLHAGARLELAEAGVWYAVGGVVDADYWLADTDLAEARLLVARIDNALRVKLVAGPTLVVDARVIAVDDEVAWAARLNWGGVGMRGVVMVQGMSQAIAGDSATLGPANDATALSTKGVLPNAVRGLRGLAALPQRMTGKGLGLTALALVAVVLPLGLVVSTLGSMLDRHSTRLRQQEAIAAQQTPGAALATARTAAQRLGDLIGMRSVTVTAVDAKTLRVAGNRVPPERRDAVREAIAGFRTDYTVIDAIAYEPDSQRRVVELTAMPDGIDFIRFGSAGYLRGSDGKTVLPGGRLKDGSKVVTIGESEILLNRGEDQFVLRPTLPTGPSEGPP